MKRRNLLYFGIILGIALIAGCASGPAQEELVASAMAEIRLHATETQRSLPTPTATEIPDPFESVILPEGSGSLQKEGEQWFFNSSLTADLGKHVPVQISEHTYEDGTVQTWLALVDHPEWPLFIQNETGGWDTALEYVEVKRPLVNNAGEPVALDCSLAEYEGEITPFVATEEDVSVNGWSILDCFFIANGESFVEGAIEYLPVAVSLDGGTENPMYTKAVVAFQDNYYYETYDTYANRVFASPNEVELVIGQSLRRQILDSLEVGDVLWVEAYTDRINADETIAWFRAQEWGEGAALAMEGVKNWREKVKSVFGTIENGGYDNEMQGRIELWLPAFIVIGK